MLRLTTRMKLAHMDIRACLRIYLFFEVSNCLVILNKRVSRQVSHNWLTKSSLNVSELR